MAAIEAVSYYQWRPPQSPLQVEFRAGLLRDLGIVQDRNSSGILYGVRHGRLIRLLAAGPSPPAPPTGGAGLPPVGIFSYRVRGEVFMTEGDLARFDRSGAQVALIIAAGRAGFFVRESAGALCALRSHQEFPVQALMQPLPRTAPDAPAPPQKPPPRSTPLRVWALALILALPLGALGLLPPLAPPLNLQLRQTGSQLLLSWNPRAPTAGGHIEILDGGQRTVAPLLPGQSSATYAIRTGDIVVTLRANPERGSQQRETIRYTTALTPAP